MKECHKVSLTDSPLKIYSREENHLTIKKILMNTLIEKEFDIEQPIGLVWKSLSNPPEIVECVPGAAITEILDAKNYKGEVVTKFGPIKAKYAGDIEILELDEANHKMVLKGRGLDSKGKGSADMVMHGTLTENSGKTNVKFSMDITIVGMLAQFGSRLINDVSDQLLNEFITNFRNKLASSTPSQDTESTAEHHAVQEEKSSVVMDSNIPTESKPSTSKKDNSLNAFALIGTVLRSIFGSIIDAIKSLFGANKK